MLVKTFSVHGLIFLTLFPHLLIAQKITEDLQTLAMGEQIILPVSAGTSYSVGNTEVLSVKLNLADGHTQLLVKARSQGYSDLLLQAPQRKPSTVRFRVISKKLDTAIRDGLEDLKRLPGLSLLPQGNKWIAVGNFKNLEAYNRLQSSIQITPNAIVDQTALDPVVRESAIKKIQNILTANNFSGFKTWGHGPQVWLEGNASSQAEKQKVESIAREVIRNIKCNISVPFEAKDILRFRVQILELAKTQGEKSGLSWSEQIPEIIKIQNAFAKGAINMEASLELLEEKGLAKILSRPEITLNSEGTAELKVGGEFPISLRSGHFAGVQWKNYGLNLKLQVPGVSRNLARTFVTVEISSLDPANGMDGMPATKLNSLQTVLDLSIGKTVFLTGLVQDLSAENIKQLPLLGDIPILGELFKSKRFQEKKSQLVMAITAQKEN